MAELSLVTGPGIIPRIGLHIWVLASTLTPENHSYWSRDHPGIGQYVRVLASTLTPSYRSRNHPRIGLHVRVLSSTLIPEDP